MPSVRVMLNPIIAQEIIETDLEFDLSYELRREVSETLGVDIEHVEVLWQPLLYAANTAPVMIDVLYSVRESFQPDEKTRRNLAESLGNLALEHEGWPEEVTEVAVWVLPQHDATFRVVKRE